jgi:hypothetical protein
MASGKVPSIANREDRKKPEKIIIIRFFIPPVFLERVKLEKPDKITRTAEKDNWNDTLNSAGGYMIKIIKAAIANVLIESCFLPIKNVIKNTDTIITAL